MSFALAIGVGLSSSATAENLGTLLDECLGLAPAHPIGGFYTLDRKAMHPALLEVAKAGKLPIFGLSEANLRLVPLENPSCHVQRAIGLGGVAEAAALIGAGKSARLIIPKRKGLGATIAIAVGEST